MATLRDISQHTSVSIGIVSKVLNRKDGVRTSKETRQRIFEAAREMDYRPSVAARALVTGKTRQIALLIEMAGEFENPISLKPDVQGLLEAAARENYRVVLLPLLPGKAGEQQLEDLARDKWCDGVCLFCRQLSAAHFAVLERHDIPRVLIGDWDTNEDVQCELTVRVDHDNYRYAFDSVMWLAGQGHSDIGWAMTAGDAGQPHNLDLRRGYQDALAEIGSKPHILPARYVEQGPEEFLRSRTFSAVIVRYVHDIYSWFHLATLAGLKVPGDLTILGHVDTTETGLLGSMAPQLAFHCHNSRRAGEYAGEILMEWAAGHTPSQHLILVEPHVPLWGGRVQRLEIESLENELPGNE